MKLPVYLHVYWLDHYASELLNCTSYSIKMVKSLVSDIVNWDVLQ